MLDRRILKWNYLYTIKFNNQNKKNDSLRVSQKFNEANKEFKLLFLGKNYHSDRLDVIILKVLKCEIFQNYYVDFGFCHSFLKTMID